MSNVIVSVPGKLMLLGDHAVVYDRGCLVTAVDQRLKVRATRISDRNCLLSAPDLNVSNKVLNLDYQDINELDKSDRFVAAALNLIRKKYHSDDSFLIETKSDFSSSFGFGSSSAVTVGVIKAVTMLLGQTLSNQELFDLSYQVVLEVQGVGSGFDLAAGIYGGVIYFEKGGRKIESLLSEEIPLVVGYTGIKADTPTLVRQVTAFRSENLLIVDGIFDLMQEIVLEAKELLIAKNWSSLGQLMNIYQGLLDSLGVSSVELATLVFAARRSGAYGAKLSGAGGGDCMICLTNQQKTVGEDLTKAGAQVLPVKTAAPGCKVETDF